MYCFTYKRFFLIAVFIFANTASAVQLTLTGPELPNDIQGHRQSGIVFSARHDVTLESFVFNNQGGADVITLKDENGNILETYNYAGGDSTHQVNINWPLSAGQKYFLSAQNQNESNGKWGKANFPVSNAHIKVENGKSQAAPNSPVIWFSFTDLVTEGPESDQPITAIFGTKSLDFNNDGKADLLWRDSATGYQTGTLMDGTTKVNDFWIGGDQDWIVVGIADFNNDGKTDLIWRQNSTGYYTGTLMDGSTKVNDFWIGGNQDWTIVGIADFNNDGKTDLIWRQNSTGYHTGTLMDGATKVNDFWIGGDLDWAIKFIGDLDGDGSDDLIWEQNSTGYHTGTLMDGATKVNDFWIGGNSEWSVIF